jgi:alkaline phosphatase D
MKIIRQLGLLTTVILAVIVGMGMPLPILDVDASQQKLWLPLPDGEISRIAFGSCAKQWLHQSIWNAVIAAKPDLWLYLGDAIYADTDGKTAWSVSVGQLKGEWNRLAEKPEFQLVKRKIPFMATWDNHDYGTHSGGDEFHRKEASKRLFLDFFGEPIDSDRRKTPGIYDAKIFGPEGRQVQIILLDTRYFKDRYKKDPRPKSERLKAGKVGGYLPDNDPEKTLLGNRQWRWLAKQLQKPAEVRLIASSIQIIPDQKGMDEWGNFPMERKRMFDVIARAGLNNVILLSGNVHFAEISKNDAGAESLHELTSSGMTHTNLSYSKAANQFRVAGPFIEHNFGLVEIDWDAKPSPQVTLNVIGQDGKTGFSKTITLTALQGHSPKNKQKMVTCPKPRPQVCTRDYRPVCAQIQGGRVKTYSNGCTACTDTAVRGYRVGACE